MVVDRRIASLRPRSTCGRMRRPNCIRVEGTLSSRFLLPGANCLPPPAPLLCCCVVSHACAYASRVRRAESVHVYARAYVTRRHSLGVSPGVRGVSRLCRTCVVCALSRVILQHTCVATVLRLCRRQGAQLCISHLPSPGTLRTGCCDCRSSARGGRILDSLPRPVF